MKRKLLLKREAGLVAFFRFVLTKNLNIKHNERVWSLANTMLSTSAYLLNKVAPCFSPKQQ